MFQESEQGKGIELVLVELVECYLLFAFLLFTFGQHANNTWRVAHDENIYNKLIELNLFWRLFYDVFILNLSLLYQVINIKKNVQ